MPKMRSLALCLSLLLAGLAWSTPAHAREAQLPTKAEYLPNGSSFIYERTAHPVRVTASRPRSVPLAATSAISPKPSSVKKLSPVRRENTVRSVCATSSCAKAYARTLVSSSQWPCLLALWTHESGWQTHNSYGLAYGIPQALPGSKMAAVGSDWRWNAVTQIRWGLGYIHARYGSPCAAWAHYQRVSWY